MPSSVRGGACQDSASEGEAWFLLKGLVLPVQAVCRPHAECHYCCYYYCPEFKNIESLTDGKGIVSSS